jgi:aspartyl-tRNA(Asn)/glutamyl-tRNA(Gln) amidotransferase subunit B
MHEGRLRFEANISVRPVGSDKLGTKVEVKNLNSTKIVLKCIEYETARQIDVLESGGRVIQETRLWDDAKSQTQAMRSKEEAQDYRYFPDPDLVEVVIDDAWLEEVRRSVPELPGARAERFIAQFGMPEYDAVVLTGRKELADYYESAIAVHNNPKAISNWIMTEILRLLNEGEVEVESLPVSAAHLAGLVRLIDDQTINGKIAKEVFRHMLEGEGDPAAIVKTRGLAQVTDTGAIEAVVDEVLAANEASVADYRSGKEKALKHLMGQVMKASKGKANPGLVQDLIKKKLA